MTNLKFGLLALVLMAPAAGFAQSTAVNVVVDMEGVDQAQYQKDLQSCQGASAQVQKQAAERESVAGTTARTAAAGAAAGAISGGSGTQGAKTGAGVGIVAASARNAKNRRAAKANTNNEREMVVKNCMRGRGYNVLN